MSRRFQIPTTITTQAINRDMQNRVGTKHWQIDVDSTQRWLLGSLPELADPQNDGYVSFSESPWTIYSHYDYVWSMWGYHQDFDQTSPLVYTRATDDSAVYGFMSKEAVLRAREDVKEEEKEYGEPVDKDRIQDFLIDRAEQLGGNVEFGRGADTYYLFIAKEGDQILAWALLLDRVVEDITENV